MAAVEYYVMRKFAKFVSRYVLKNCQQDPLQLFTVCIESVIVDRNGDVDNDCIIRFLELKQSRCYRKNFKIDLEFMCSIQINPNFKSQYRTELTLSKASNVTEAFIKRYPEVFCAAGVTADNIASGDLTISELLLMPESIVANDDDHSSGEISSMQNSSINDIISSNAADSQSSVKVIVRRKAFSDMTISYKEKQIETVHGTIIEKCRDIGYANSSDIKSILQSVIQKLANAMENEKDTSVSPMVNSDEAEQPELSAISEEKWQKFKKRSARYNTFSNEEKCIILEFLEDVGDDSLFTTGG